MPSLPAKMKILLILEEMKCLEKQKLMISNCALFHMKTRVSLKYFVSYWLLSLETFFILTCPRLFQT